MSVNHIVPSAPNWREQAQAAWSRCLQAVKQHLPPARISYGVLSGFCDRLATCLAAGLGVPESLRASGEHSACVPLRRACAEARMRAEQGEDLAGALGRHAAHFPSFFLPVIQCGEESGRLTEALEFLSRHCSQLAGPARQLRNTWLYPLVILGAGWLIRVLLVAVFGSLRWAARDALASLVSYLPPAILVGVIVLVPRARSWFLWVVAQVPVIGEAVRALSLHRFFHAFHLLYASGGIRVQAMIRLAAQTVSEPSLRQALDAAARAIEQGSSIGDAFQAQPQLPTQVREAVASGDESGKLEDSCERIVRLMADEAAWRLRAFQEVFFRVMVALVVFSIGATALALVSAPR